MPIYFEDCRYYPECDQIDQGDDCQDCPLFDSEDQPMTPDRELFEWLKREGECCHLFEPDGDSFSMLCSKCGEYQDDISFIPNLSSPGWPEFGWLWERAKEKEWWEDFLIYLQSIKKQNRFDNGLEYFMGVGLIDPARFTRALFEFLEEHDRT